MSKVPNSNNKPLLSIARNPFLPSVRELIEIEEKSIESSMIDIFKSLDGIKYTVLVNGVLSDSNYIAKKGDYIIVNFLVEAAAIPAILTLATSTAATSAFVSLGASTLVGTVLGSVVAGGVLALTSSLMPKPQVTKYSTPGEIYGTGVDNNFREGDTINIVYGTSLVPIKIFEQKSYPRDGDLEINYLAVVCEGEVDSIEKITNDGQEIVATIEKRFGTADQTPFTQFGEVERDIQVNLEYSPLFSGRGNRKADYKGLFVGKGCADLGAGITYIYFGDGTDTYRDYTIQNQIYQEIDVVVKYAATVKDLYHPDGCAHGVRVQVLDASDNVIGLFVAANYIGFNDGTGRSGRTTVIVLPVAGAVKLRVYSEIISGANTCATCLGVSMAGGSSVLEYVAEKLPVSAVDGIQSYPYTALLAMNAFAKNLPQGIKDLKALVTRTKSRETELSGKSLTNPSVAARDLILNQEYGYDDKREKIVWSEFEAWEQYCIDNDYEVNITIDGNSTRSGDAIRWIAEAGQAKIFQRGDIWRVSFNSKSSQQVAKYFIDETAVLKDSLTIDTADESVNVNAVEISFFNRDNNYEKETILIQEKNFDDKIEELKKQEVVYYGVTKTSQAVKLANYLLNSTKYGKSTASFKMNIQAIAFDVGDIIGLTHRAIGNDTQAGDITAISTTATTTKITLDKKIASNISSLPPTELKVNIKDTDSGITQTFDIASFGDRDITIASLPSVKEGDRYAIGIVSEINSLYQIENLRVSDPTDFIVDIEANSWDKRIFDTGDDIDIIDNVDLEAFNLNVILSQAFENGIEKDKLFLTWQGKADSYNIYYRYEGGEWTFIEPSKIHQTFLSNIEVGKYEFSVVYGKTPDTSPQTSFEVTDTDAPPPPVETFLVDTTTAPTLKWLYTNPPDMKLFNLYIGNDGDFSNAVLLTTLDKVSREYDISHLSIKAGESKYFFIKPMDNNNQEALTTPVATIVGDLVLKNPFYEVKAEEANKIADTNTGVYNSVSKCIESITDDNFYASLSPENIYERVDSENMYSIASVPLNVEFSWVAPADDTYALDLIGTDGLNLEIGVDSDPDGNFYDNRDVDNIYSASSVAAENMYIYTSQYIFSPYVTPITLKKDELIKIRISNSDGVSKQEYCNLKIHYNLQGGTV